MRKSKTMWFAALLAGLSVVQGYIVQLPISPQHQAWIGMGIAVVVAVLRIVTTEPVNEK